MRKALLKLIIALTSIFLMNQIVFALDPIIGTVTGENVGFRKCASTNAACTRLYGLDYGAEIIMINKDITPGAGCNDGWYKGTYNNTEGYICSTYVTFKTIIPPLDPGAYQDYTLYLNDLGFIEPGYTDKLATLHAAHPNWIFKPVVTSINWFSAVNAESVDGKSCTYSANQGYYLTDNSVYDYLNDSFRAIDPNCYAANQGTVSYYLDPRNWLNERNIFMFEDLTYHSEYQSLELVNGVLKNNNNLKGYVNEFYNAATQVMDDGSTKTISPIHLATRSRQEIGNANNGLLRVNGEYPYSYCTYTNLTGYYNFYNIGSYSDACTPLNTPSARGMMFACGPNCGWPDSFGRPWNTPQKGINGGAQFLINNYFNRGQDTIYFQKFNTSGLSTPFTNQYMQNIAAPASEAGTSYVSYADGSALENPIVFKIPVYIGMPEGTSLPNPGNPNNHLSSLLVNEVSVSGFSHDKYEYNLILPNNIKSLKITGNPINAKAQVKGLGVINVDANTTEVLITVVAENGSEQIYSIKLSFTNTDIVIMSPDEIVSNANIKSDGVYLLGLNEGASSALIIENIQKVNLSSIIVCKDRVGAVKAGNLATGDIISITNNNVTKDFPIVIVGDGNGDGKINIADLLSVQKHILGVNSLSGAYLMALDVTNDGLVNINDLLKVQKYILGYSKFE